MESTRRLDIELPEDLADAVEARVRAGEYASVSEVVEEGLRALATRDDDPVRVAWEQDELTAAYDAWKADPAAVMTVDEVRRKLADARRAHG
ncbi:MAG: ribbon-helix-helix protein, CopG family [Sphingomonas sp.]|jgi:antitoxin ParD1/3/4|uniref:ribbon-helix-helix domain-containing protein n=1 Tax=Sphingomonas sp. TaxID=28214 RepID=UPI0026203E69|nr:ribbon-helix-helix protein, CopG family [Sphingomonas sp.]MDK2766855.1 ribbon-helix-helix protein, CopG family [Sphingomonas sp.]